MKEIAAVVAYRNDASRPLVFTTVENVHEGLQHSSTWPDYVIHRRLLIIPVEGAVAADAIVRWSCPRLHSAKPRVPKNLLQHG